MRRRGHLLDLELPAVHAPVESVTLCDFLFLASYHGWRRATPVAVHCPECFNHPNPARIPTLTPQSELGTFCRPQPDEQQAIEVGGTTEGDVLIDRGIPELWEHTQGLVNRF